MKIKARTKKILVLSVMVVLLVATGVLNWALNDKLNTSTEQANAEETVTETFFAAYRSDRDSTRESEYLYLDAILTSAESTETSKTAAEAQKLALVERMEKELQLETLVKAKGFDDAIVTISENGVNVVVGVAELSAADAAQILSIVQDETTFKATAVKIIPYN